MMSLLFLATCVAVTAIPLDQLSLRSNVLANANPASINKLKAYVDQLVKDGNDEISGLIYSRDQANTKNNKALKELSLALTALNAAKAHHQVTIRYQQKAAREEQHAKAVRAQKLKIKQDKHAVLVTATETDRTEQIRLNKEKALFEKVKGLLNSAKAEGRRLLNAEEDIAPIMAMINLGSNADPNQVKEANKLLDELIVAGEDERARVVAALAQATHEYNTATHVHIDAVAAHVHALGVLEAANRDKEEACKQLDLRKEEHSTATSYQQGTQKDLDAKQAKLTSETRRIKNEEADLKQIKKLLEKLD